MNILGFLRKNVQWFLLMLVCAIASIMLVSFPMVIGVPKTHATELTIKFAHTNQPTHPKGQGAELFAKKVTEYTNGRIKVNVYPASQLGSDREVFLALKSGSIEMAVEGFSLLADAVPEFSALLGGYFYKNFADIEKVVNHADFGQKWTKELIQKSQVRVLDCFYFGARCLTTTNLPVKRPDDLKGRKIRAIPSQISLAIVRGLGANPTPVSFAELTMALRQGVVDGQENPFPTIWTQKFYEVQKYLILTRHQVTADPYVINERIWQKITRKDQKAILKAAEEGCALSTKLTIDMEAELLDKLKAKGMEIIGTEQGLDLEAFRKSVQAEMIKTFDGPIWKKGTATAILELLK